MKTVNLVLDFVLFITKLIVKSILSKDLGGTINNEVYNDFETFESFEINVALCHLSQSDLSRCQVLNKQNVRCKENYYGILKFRFYIQT